MAAGPERFARQRRGRAVRQRGQLAKVYGFTDVDGTQPDVWQHMVEVNEKGLGADLGDYR